MGWTARELPDLTGRVAVVTGANSGIGWCTAYELAQHGARVVLACRDVERGKQAADEMRRQAGRIDVECHELNLAATASVREFVSGWSGPLDLLVNNAGVMAPPKRLTTADGFELQFGVNHLGHFVLTGLLLPALLQAPSARVVTVSSIAHKSADLATLNPTTAARYVPRQVYANSKLANLLFALELQRLAERKRLPLTSIAAHPGLSSTGLFRDREGIGAGRLTRLAAPLVMGVVAQSPATAARAVLYAATAAAPGGYVGPTGWHETRGPVGPAQVSATASDATLARRVWQLSEELTGFHYPWPG